MGHNLLMRDRGTKSTNISAGTGIGVLVVTGFSGSPGTVIQAILESEHVKDVTIRRSGSQIELTVELSHTATLSRLRDVVEQLQEFDATVQGSQSQPVPTLVFSLVPAKTRDRGFHLSRLRRGSSASDRKTPPQNSTPRRETAAAESIPVQTHTTIVARPTPVTPPPEPEPEVTTQEAPGPVVLIAKSAGRAILLSISTELQQAASILGRAIRTASSFTGRQLAQLTVRAVRPISGSLTALSGAIYRISFVITAVGNSVFGTGVSDETGTDGESETGPSETTDPKSDRDHRD